MAQNLVLIGPVSVGKSTLGQLLSVQLNRPHCSLDDARWNYFNEIGFDKDVQHHIWQTKGIDGVLRYWQPFEAYAVERVLADYQDAVIDFGGGYTIQDDPALFFRVQQALLPHYVVLLLPSRELTASIQILSERTRGKLPESFDLEGYIAKHQATYSLAKLLVYTEGMSPEETRDYIMDEFTKAVSSVMAE